MLLFLFFENKINAIAIIVCAKYQFKKLTFKNSCLRK